MLAFFGWTLTLVGGLIATLAGLCSLVLASDGREGRMYALLGVVPLVVGGGVLAAGLVLLREHRRTAVPLTDADLARLSEWRPPRTPETTDEP